MYVELVNLPLIKKKKNLPWKGTHSDEQPFKTKKTGTREMGEKARDSITDLLITE